MTHKQTSPLLVFVGLCALAWAVPAFAQDASADALKKVAEEAADAKVKGDTAWMLVSTAWSCSWCPAWPCSTAAWSAARTSSAP